MPEFPVSSANATRAFAGSSGAAAVAPYPPPATAWYATGVLAFLFWMSMLDRFIISLLVEPIKADLGLTDVQFGVLQGVAFVASFTLFGFVFGALADRSDRRRLIFIGVVVWSLASAACGLAANFWHLLIARLGLGAGEASLNPCATSMIADLFPRDKLTSAMAVYTVGAAIGSGTALVIGGAVIHWVSGLGDIVLPVIGHVKTWQMVFFIIGLSSLPFVFLVFTFPDPVRRNRSKALQESGSWRTAYSDLARFVKTHPRFFFAHYVGFTVCTIVVSGCLSWYPVHMIRVYGWSEGRVGLFLGVTMMAAGIVGKLACGWVVDGMYRRGYRDAQLRWYATCMLIAAPLGIIATTSGNAWVFLTMIGFFVVLNTSLMASAMASLSLVTPNELRGAGVAVFSTVAGLLGGSAGAILVPLVSQSLYSGSGAYSIGYGMATVIGVVCPLGALILASGLKAMRTAMADIEEQPPRTDIDGRKSVTE